MADYSIGLSGLDAAQKALDVIGNNIANAATAGYHRQSIELSPAFSLQQGSTLLGGGVDIKGVTRSLDSLLEQEILRQESSLSQISREATTLQTIENIFGELSSEDGGLNTALDSFFNSLQNLSAYPADAVWQNQVISDAEALTGQFRTIGSFLDSLQSQISLEADSTVDSINTLVEQIADFNARIEQIEIVGGQANSMRDQRDLCLSQLSELIGIQTINREYGVVDVVASGIPLVVHSYCNKLQSGFSSDEKLGFSVEGASSYITSAQGGKLGGLLSLKNETIVDIQNDLDALACSIIQNINKYHTEGVGTDGSFSELTGWSMPTENLSDINSITDGEIYIRVTNTSTGVITRHSVSIDADGDSLTDIASSISGIPGLSAYATSSNRLVISADANYTFDFIPAVLPEPTVVNFDDATPPSVSIAGIYTGDVNDSLVFTVKGDGSVGNGTLELEVRDSNGAGNVVKIVNIGSGYAAGDEIDLGNGIKISLGGGNLAETDGDSFTVDVFAETDTSGFLSAVGLNTFFSGTCATDMAVCLEISGNPGRIAAAIGPDTTDNNNIMRMADVQNKALDDLESLACGEFYRQMVNGIGQQVSLKEMNQDNAEVMVLELNNRQNEISGVDINNEAAQLLVFEQMFQAMAKYMSTINSSMQTMMEIL